MHFTPRKNLSQPENDGFWQRNLPSAAMTLSSSSLQGIESWAKTQLRLKDWAFVRGFTLRKNINVYWIYVFMLYIIYVCSMYYTFSWYVYISTWYEYITINIHNIAILWDCMRLPKVLPNLFQNLSISSGLRHWKTWLWPDRSTIQTWCLPRTGWGKPRYWRHLLPLSMVALHAGIRKMEHLPVHMWRLVLLIVKKKQIDAIAA